MTVFSLWSIAIFASCHRNHFRSLIKIVVTCAVASDLASFEMGWSSLSWRTVGGESRLTFSPFWCGHDRSRRHTRHHHQSRLKWNNVRIWANEHRTSTIQRQKKTAYRNTWFASAVGGTTVVCSFPWRVSGQALCEGTLVNNRPDRRSRRTLHITTLQKTVTPIIESLQIQIP